MKHFYPYFQRNEMNAFSLAKIKAFKSIFLILILSAFAISAYSQCGTPAVTAASCPANGRIVISPVPANTNYVITAGPAGFPTASNSTGIFNSLTPGTYTIVASGGCTATYNNIVVTSTYPTYSVTATTSNVCNGSAGGTINVSVTGGRPNYVYDIVPVGTNPTYGAPTSSTTFSEAQSSYGIYRVYTQDACGEVRTFDIELAPTVPPMTDVWYQKLFFDRPCNAPLIDGLPTATLHLNFLNALGAGVDDLTPVIGATVRMYKPVPANSISSTELCSNTLGTLLGTTTINAASLGSNTQDLEIVIPQEDLIFVYSDACGNTFRWCYDFNDGNPVPAPNFNLEMTQGYCSTAGWGQQELIISSNEFVNLIFPLTHLITKADGSTLTQGPINDNYVYFWAQLTMADLPATYKVTDACGKTVTKTITAPVQGSPITTDALIRYTYSCTAEAGAAPIYLQITGGDFPGLYEAAETATITGGPATIVPVIGFYSAEINAFELGNLVPNTEYTITMTNACGQTVNIVFNSGDLEGMPPLSWNLVATREALCGQNMSTITVNGNLPQGVAAQYCLTSPNITTPICNSTGIFSNLPPNTYQIALEILNGQSWSCPNSMLDQITVVVPPDAVGQSIVRKTIFACEDINGDVLPTGFANVEVTGSSPFTYEIIKTSSLPGGTWTLSSTNNLSNTYSYAIPLPGDPFDTEYTIRSTDKCGNAVTTNASLQPLSEPQLAISNTQPCINANNYTLTLTELAGDFTYKWYNTSTPAVVISNSNVLTFSGPYSASYNGNYECEIKFGDCVVRLYAVTLNSNNCGGPLNALTLIGTVYHDVTGLTDMVVTDGTGLGNPSATPLYANLLSADGTTVVASVLVNNDGTYELPVVANTTYIVQISTKQGTAGQPTPATALPASWMNTGDVNPTDPTATAATAGLSAPVEVVTSNVVMVDFGIQQAPETAVNLQPSQVNPGGTTSVSVPTSAFQISNVGTNPNTDDPSTGTVTSINIPTFPTNATSITVNGVTYTSATFPVGGITIPYTDGVGPNQAVSVDPIDGATSVVIPIIAIDNAGVADPTAGSITLPFSSPLPVTLISFGAKQIEESIVSTWKVSDEKNFSHYELLRSQNAQEFGAIGRVSATNSSIYNFIDKNPLEGNNYYKLIMVNTDGTSTASNTVVVKYTKGGEFITVENPARNGEFMVITNLPKAKFSFYTSTGAIINIKSTQLSDNKYIINTTAPSGIYFIGIESKGKFATKKVVIP